jgi:hypothetical protein
MSPIKNGQDLDSGTGTPGTRLSIEELLRLVLDGKIDLSASPLDLKSAKELKALQKRLSKENINLKIVDPPL